MSLNERQTELKAEANDELYTTPEFAAEVCNKYAEHLRGKTVFCPCDDPRWSGFPKYLLENFFALDLRAVVCACYYPRKDGKMEQLTAIFHPERHRGVFADGKKIDNPYLERAVVDRNRTDEEKAFRLRVARGDAAYGARGVKFPTSMFGAAQKNIMVSLVETVSDLPGGKQQEFEECRVKVDEDKIATPSLKGAFELTKITRRLLELCDVVITNPPYSKLTGKGEDRNQGLLEILLRQKIDFILLGPQFPNKTQIEAVRVKKLFFADKPKNVIFNLPNGGQQANGTSVYSSFEVARGERLIGAKNKKVAEVFNEGLGIMIPRDKFAKTAYINDRKIAAATEANNGILAVDNVLVAPIDYEGIIGVPMTAAASIYGGCGFEIVGQGLAYAYGERKNRNLVFVKKVNQKQNKEAAVVTANKLTPDRGEYKRDLGYVYLIYDGKDRIKIGITRREVGQRLRDYWTYLPCAAVWDVSPAIEDYAVAETLLHDQFKAYNVGGEWFKIEAYPEIKKAFLAMTEPCKNRK